MLLCILADLPMDLGSITILGEEVVIHAVQIPLFLICCSIGIIILVLDNLPLRKLVVGKQGRKKNPRRLTLRLCRSLLLLWLSLFLLLGRCTQLDTGR